MKAKYIISLLIVLVIAAAIAWQQMNKPPLQLWVTAASQGVVEATVANTRAGTVKACRRSKLSMPIGGVVDRLLVDEGDQVKQGQLLLELWNRDRKADVAQAEQTHKIAELEEVRACTQARFNQREAKRLKRLSENDLASVEAVDNAETIAENQQRSCDAAKAQVKVAEAQREYQRAILERTQLRAPFDGVVAEINGETGEYVTPSPPGVATPPAVDLIDYSCLYVTAPIDEVDASRLQIGLPTRVTLDAFRDREFSGELVRIAPYVLDLEKQARTVDIDVKLLEQPEDVALLVGYSADAIIILERKESALRIPTEALLPDNQLWVLDDDGKLHKKTVEVGIGNWSYTEIISGLSEGEQVVRSPDQPGIAAGVTAVAVDD